ncbi:MAG: FliO/MopB family protein [Planctomycetes bacterium]|nr:FliO/MopB family protein [Planctomycetota bacterium]
MASSSAFVHANDGSGNSEVGSGVAPAVNQATSVELAPAAEAFPQPTANAFPVENANPPTVVPGFGFPRFVHRRTSEPAGAEINRSTAVPWYRSALGSLGIVLAIIGLLFLALKRWLPAKRWTDGAKVMSIAARTMIDGKHGLALVRVGHRFVMIGVSPDRLTALAEISESSEVAELSAKTNTASGNRLAGFDRLLRGEVDSFEGLVNESEVADGIATSRSDQSPKALRTLIGRLRSLQSSKAN